MAVKIELTTRHYGVHTLIREAEIPGEFSDYATRMPPGGLRLDEYAIDEDKLIAALPAGFLKENFAPQSPRNVLLAIGDENGATGQSGLSRFRNWAKYFDAHTLTIMKPAKHLNPEEDR